MNDSQLQVTRSRRGSVWTLSALCLGVCIFSLGTLLGLWIGTTRLSEVSFGQFLTHLPDELRAQEDANQALSNVWSSIQDRYFYGPQDGSTMYYGALSGLVGSLGDPYSVFLNPEMTESFTTDLEGSFEGIGAEIGYKDDQLSVIAPLPNSPAARAGLRAGDIILRIDDTDAFSLSLPEAISRIRGPKETTVVMEVLREGSDESIEVSIVRESIVIESVQWEMRDDGFAYLRIIQFDARTVSLFERALRETLAESPRGFILDLRDNPGGYLDSAVDIAEKFLADEGTVVVIEEFSTGETKEYTTDEPGSVIDIPVVVLVNAGSASASEILAGALQDHERAKLVGEKTFGKGTVQDFEQYADGSSLKLTVALWFTPDKRSINDTGIDPDIIVAAPGADDPTDPQLNRALEVLTQEATL